MISESIHKLLQNALAEAQRREELPAVTIEDFGIDRPQDRRFGDYASGMALKMARAARKSPLDIAKLLVTYIPPCEEFSKVEVAPPGFINFTVDPSWLQKQVDVVLGQGTMFGNVDVGRRLRVQLEYASVNPTGPVHVGHGRAATLGSALANVLEAAGYDVTREYYVNDGGNQLELFAASIYARYLQALGREATMPENGYQGEYVTDFAREIIAEHGDRFATVPADQGAKAVGKLGMEKALSVIRADLEKMNIRFDVWFSELSLYADGTYEKTMDLLRSQGYIAEKEGAQWFASTALGEEKDNVLVRSNGIPTYFAADIAYHYNKFIVRKFQRVIDIWGADHQGHVPRMKAAARAMGVDPDDLEIITVQLVSLKKGDAALRFSKRKGNVIALADLVEEVGADAVRYFFLTRSADTQMEFDLELATKEAPDNPVYYIQYAHARIASIQRTAREQGIHADGADLSLLTHEAELDLIRAMLQLPEVVERCATQLSPHHLTHYALDLAGLFHDFYTQCRVITEDRALTAARLRLVEAARVALARTLTLLGMSVPERM